MNEPLVCEDCQTTNKVKTVYLMLTKEGYKDLCPKCRDKREAPHISGRSRRAD
jgi:hypothetical protein